MKIRMAAGWATCLGALALAGATAHAADATLKSGNTSKKTDSGAASSAVSWSSSGTGSVHASVMVKTVGPDGKETVVYKSTDGSGTTSGDSPAKSARLGVSAQPIDDTLRSQLALDPGVGLVVNSVLPDSPAQKAGLKNHDVLVKLDDQRLMSSSQLRDLVRAHKAGDTVTLGYVRAGKPETAKVTIEESEDPVAGQTIDLGTFKMDLQEMLKNLPDEHRAMIVQGLGSMTNMSGRVTRRVTLGGTPAFVCAPQIIGTNGTITIDLDKIMKEGMGSGTIVIQAGTAGSDEEENKKDEDDEKKEDSK